MRRGFLTSTNEDLGQLLVKKRDTEDEASVWMLANPLLVRTLSGNLRVCAVVHHVTVFPSGPLWYFSWTELRGRAAEMFGADRSMCGENNVSMVPLASLPMEFTRLANEMLAPTAVFSTENT